MKENKAFRTIKAHSPTLSVGILSADLLNLRSEIDMLESTDITMLHFDVMDGCFGPKMTVGPPFVKAVKTELLKDVHLMVENPEEKFYEYVNAGADIITIHHESSEDVLPVLIELGKMENKNESVRGIVRGVALSPDVPVEKLKPLLDNLEMIVVLAVNPKVERFPFFDSYADKVREVKEMVSKSDREIILCIDGGIKKDNIKEFAELHPDILVSGSAVFKGNSPIDNIRYMLGEIRSQRDKEIK